MSGRLCQSLKPHRGLTVDRRTPGWVRLCHHPYRRGTAKPGSGPLSCPCQFDWPTIETRRHLRRAVLVIFEPHVIACGSEHGAEGLSEAGRGVVGLCPAKQPPCADNRGAVDWLVKGRIVRAATPEWHTANVFWIHKRVLSIWRRKAAVAIIAIGITAVIVPSPSNPAYESYLGLSGDPYWVDDGPGRRGANAKKAYKQGGGTQLCPHLLVLLNLQRST